ncbi:hypothetical protein ABC383_22820 [Noviherbaspirillum sp. 1P10PC]|uniref:hypothetical protein n=1 Tax=Noviherbaspirillum sp. 1P10PC TaxID=3132292 RepID=UPI0039A11121
MESAISFLTRSENAVRALLHQNAIYADKVKNIQKSIPLASIALNETTSQLSFDDWRIKNKDEKHIIIDAHQKYSTEAFTCGLLAGSILRMANRAIGLYSENTHIPDEWNRIFNKRILPARFFVGRIVHTIPIGLLIFCGLNQFINTTNREIEALNREVFRRLATYGEQFEFRAFVEQETTYRKLHSEYLATNVIDILGWNDYDCYFEDMRRMLL